MSTENQFEATNNSPELNILEQAGEIIKQLRPEILRRLGGVATIGVDGPDQEYVYKLADTAEAIRAELDSMEDAINAIPTTSDVSASSTTSAGQSRVPPEEAEIATPLVLTELEAAILAYVKTGTAFRTEELRAAIPALQMMSASEYKQFKSSFPEMRKRLANFLQDDGGFEWVETGAKRGKRYQLIESSLAISNNLADVEELTIADDDHPADPASKQKTIEEVYSDDLAIPKDISLSPNEAEILRNTLQYLRAFEERKSFREVVSEVFGRPRLSKKEEERFIQILDQCVSAGILRAYGKTYGYRSLADRDTAYERSSLLEAESDVLSDSDAALIDYIAINTQNGKINIGQIVREFVGVQRLEEKEFNDFIAHLNSLAERGYLVHSSDSPWYGSVLANKSKDENYPSNATAQLPSITTTISNKPKIFTPDKEVELRNTGAEETAQTLYEIGQDKYDLSDREVAMLQAMYATAASGRWFQQKEVSFHDIKFVSGSARRQAFSKLTQRLIETGLLLADGIKGGRRYQFTEMALKTVTKDTTSDSPVTSPLPDEAEDKVHQKQTRQKLSEPNKAEQTQAPPLSRQEQVRQFRKVATFALRLTQHVTEQLEEAPERREKLATISKHIAKSLNISETAARQAVNDLVEAGHIYKNGHIRGSRTVTLDPPTAVPEQSRKTRNKRRTREVANNWTADDVDTTIMICKRLLTLRHVQQGYVINTLIKELGIPDESETAFRQSLRRAERAGVILIDKNANPNTRSDHSKKLYLPMVKFPSQKVKERWKHHPDEAIAELRSLVT